MNKNLILFRVVLLFYLVAPLSCTENRFNCSDSCCGETFEQEFTEIDSLILTTGQIEIYQGNGYQRKDFIASTSNNWETAAISIDIFELNYLAELSSTKKPNFYFNLISSAFACSPPEPEPTQKIESIIITSNQDLIVGDSTYESKTDLSALYSVVSRYTSEENQTIQEFITKQNDNPYFFGTFGSSFILKLNRRIMMPEQTITIQIEFDDLSTFELTTNDFTIQ